MALLLFSLFFTVAHSGLSAKSNHRPSTQVSGSRTATEASETPFRVRSWCAHLGSPHPLLLLSASVLVLALRVSLSLAVLH